MIYFAYTKEKKKIPEEISFAAEHVFNDTRSTVTFSTKPGLQLLGQWSSFPKWSRTFI